MLIFISFMSLFNHFWSNGISFFLNSDLSKKYGYINQTRKYLEEGKSQKAVRYAKKSYERESNVDPSRFFLLTSTYRLWSYDKKQRLLSLYGATINYGDILYNTLDSPENAIEKFKEALDIVENNLIKDQSTDLKIYPLSSIAHIYEIQGEYSKADDYYSSLEKLQADIDSQEIQDVLFSRFFLKANRAITVGDHEKAFDIYRESLDKFREQSPDKLDSPFYFQLLNLAIIDALYHENFTRAADVLVEAQTVLDKIENDLFKSQFLGIKGKYLLLASHYGQGDERLISSSFLDLFSSHKDTTIEIKMLREAELCFTEKLDISRENAGKKSPEYIQDLFALADYYVNIGDFETANPYVEEALSLMEVTGFKIRRVYEKLLFYKLLIKSELEGFDYQFAQKISQSIFESINTSFVAFTEEEKEYYAIYMNKYLGALNSAYLEQNSDKAYVAVYDNVLGIKNFALDARKNLRAYLKIANEKIKNQYADIMDRKSISNLSNEEKSDNHKRELELLKIIKEDSDYIPFKTKKTHWQQVANSLDSSQAAVEFINVEKLGTKEVIYYALVLEKNMPAPKAIRLFEEEKLKSILNVKGNSKERINQLYVQKADSLYSLIIAPVESAINSKKELLISLSGLLHNLSFPAIFKGSPLSYKIFGSTRDILKNAADSNGTINAALFGGIDYGLKKDKETPKKMEGRSPYSINTFSNLEYTEDEVLKIDSVISGRGVAAHTKIFTKEAATEKTFKNLDGRSYDIIHLATHGYYLKNYFAQDIFGVNEGLSSNSNPLARIGLALAGVNSKKGGNYGNDGLLTGMEISQMDLSNTNLVVLSACESGLGDIMSSEGVFGLQRSFKIAGVESIIVSLWQVPDKQTSELMISFYDYYVNGTPKNEALKLAQREISIKYPDPYYWAGFELIN
ncbi:CHAT domain-containing protein [Kriegella aquimaris]|uniref:CHAT domain-containing protein n=1 Tax=Kriegella aquimaris TaxID=192904 RepID=UPI00159F7697|nr:CHAT domain-containing tetratricopeptide repeat protein [Kriegella aquimaris]